MTCCSVLEKCTFSLRFRFLSLVTFASWPPAFTLLKSRLHMQLILFLNLKELISLTTFKYFQLVLFSSQKRCIFSLKYQREAHNCQVYNLYSLLQKVSNSCYASQKLLSPISPAWPQLQCLHISFPSLRKTQLEMLWAATARAEGNPCFKGKDDLWISHFEYSMGPAQHRYQSMDTPGTSTGSYLKWRHLFPSTLYWTIDKLIPKLWTTKRSRRKSSLCGVRSQLTGLSPLDISTCQMIFHLKYAWSFSCSK